MTDKELRRLSRGELIELLIDQEKLNEKLEDELIWCRNELEDRKLKLENVGSLAEAVLSINEVFSSADRAAKQYLENVRYLHMKQQEESEQVLAGAKEQADRILAEAREQAEEILAGARSGSYGMPLMVENGAEARTQASGISAAPETGTETETMPETAIGFEPELFLNEETQADISEADAFLNPEIKDRPEAITNTGKKSRRKLSGVWNFMEDIEL